MKLTDPVKRFWSKIAMTGNSCECWLWTAYRNTHGYGQFRLPKLGKLNVGSHRLAYELTFGPIPDGLQIDHLCRVRECCNPWHLEPVTPGENSRRGLGGWVNANSRKTACKHGHPFDDPNTYLYSDHRTGRPFRACRECRLMHSNAQYARRKEARGLQQ